MVTLTFGDDLVTVRRQSPGRQRALRLCGGAALLFAGFAAIAVNMEDRDSYAAGVVLWSIAASAAIAGAGGLIWWLVLAARDRRCAAETIVAGSVSSARSRAEGGVVTVSLRIGDEPERAFSADGHAGTVLATHFGWLFAVPAEPPRS